MFGTGLLYCKINKTTAKYWRVVDEINVGHTGVVPDANHAGFAYPPSDLTETWSGRSIARGSNCSLLEYVQCLVNCVVNFLELFIMAIIIYLSKFSDYYMFILSEVLEEMSKERGILYLLYRAMQKVDERGGQDE